MTTIRRCGDGEGRRCPRDEAAGRLGVGALGGVVDHLDPPARRLRPRRARRGCAMRSGQAATGQITASHGGRRARRRTISTAEDPAEPLAVEAGGGDGLRAGGGEAGAVVGRRAALRRRRWSGPSGERAPPGSGRRSTRPAAAAHSRRVRRGLRPPASRSRRRGRAAPRAPARARSVRRRAWTTPAGVPDRCSTASAGAGASRWRSSRTMAAASGSRRRGAVEQPAAPSAGRGVARRQPALDRDRRAARRQGEGERLRPGGDDDRVLGGGARDEDVEESAVPTGLDGQRGPGDPCHRRPVRVTSGPRRPGLEPVGQAVAHDAARPCRSGSSPAARGGERRGARAGRGRRGRSPASPAAEKRRAGGEKEAQQPLASVLGSAPRTAWRRRRAATGAIRGR